MTYFEQATPSFTASDEHEEHCLGPLLRNRQQESFHYENLHVSLDAPHRTYWGYMQPRDRPSYTHALMKDVATMQADVRGSFRQALPYEGSPADWFVMASSTPGIYNLGGDLNHFGTCIRARDVSALKHYGHVAVKAIHQNTIAFGAPMITIALVQGDALGGGFEHALSFDLIVAERSAKFGLPEILFNMFPGMGAYSFLSRRMDRARAEALITSGRIHSAEDLHAMGVVDVIAEDGEGEATVRDYIERHQRKHNAHYAICQARRRVNPVTLQELIDVVDLWAEAAVRLGEADLKKMARLASAQDKRIAGIGNIILEQRRA